MQIKVHKVIINDLIEQLQDLAKETPFADVFIELNKNGWQVIIRPDRGE